VKKFHRTAQKQREDVERRCVLQINVVLRKNERRKREAELFRV